MKNGEWVIGNGKLAVIGYSLSMSHYQLINQITYYQLPISNSGNGDIW
jgi:hypothetical protein